MKKVDADGIPFIVAVASYIVYSFLFTTNGNQSSLLVTAIISTILLAMTAGNRFIFKKAERVTRRIFFDKSVTIINGRFINIFLITLLVMIYSLVKQYTDMFIVSMLASIYFFSFISFKIKSANTP